MVDTGNGSGSGVRPTYTSDQLASGRGQASFWAVGWPVAAALATAGTRGHLPHVVTRTVRIRARWLALALPTIGACSLSTPLSGSFFCGDGGTCLDGFSCVNNLCVTAPASSSSSIVSSSAASSTPVGSSNGGSSSQASSQSITGTSTGTSASSTSTATGSTTGGSTGVISSGSSSGGTSSGSSSSSRPDAGCGPGRVSFAAQRVLPVGLNPTAVAVVGDGGFGDLAVTNQFDSTVSVLLNLGDGGFAAQVTYPVGQNPAALTVSDLNGDGRPDLAVANYGPLSADFFGTVSVLLNVDGGIFGPQTTYDAGYGPCSIVAGNFYLNGLPDLVETNISGDSVSLFQNNDAGPGTFLPRITYVNNAYGSPISVAVGDFNRDGQPDLAFVGNSGDFVDVLLNSGGGVFSPQVTYAVGLAPTSVAVADFNGDGWPDLAVANTGPPGSVGVLLNLGDGGFGLQTEYLVGTSPQSVAVGDFNGDGHWDIAVVNAGDGNVEVLVNLGDGGFAAQVTFRVGNDPTSVAVGDLNGDGYPDLAATSYDGGTVSVLLNACGP